VLPTPHSEEPPFHPKDEEAQPPVISALTPKLRNQPKRGPSAPAYLVRRSQVQLVLVPADE
jgi:hypothetical protein